ncbi:uncharacterized protein si:ch211-199g17.2 isoform X3 [Tachysurus vachellii]|uniref:uncharacterized protein si:ch211-199g17.2 isoform X3 n=1 Tax=Tachysurus vachellii TaxID=175792 RepID=UPI00296AE830|nr:uncharacterized protein si:ch211-199g17.2 isoform X3 [Tachysurus vachellii]
MKPLQLICQNCNMQYEKIKDFKAHVRSFRHKKEVTKLFDTVVHKGPVYFPIFVFLDYIRNPKQTQPLIGFDMVTMFITPEKIGALYLCHVCEEHLSTNDVVSHLCSVQHYFNYLANTNPELLHFAWLTDSLAYLKTTASKEYNTNGSGSLRVFELPKMMLKRCKKMPYHQAMSMFSKTVKLRECIQGSIPRRKTIQEYIADPARKNPLLGLNSLLEYSCPGFCGYLCVLCQKKIPAVQIISHCISFDHVYWYLEAAHPGTLDPPKSSYNHFSPILNKKILYVANQAQTLCPPVEIESVHLDLDSFKIINSSSYASVLENLQKKRQERNQSELNFSTTRRERIVFSPEEHESSVSTATTDSSSEQQEKKTQMDSPVVQTRDDPPCRILCVECDLTLNFIIDYKRHVKEAQHRQKLIELFGPGQYSGAISQIKLYQYMWNRKASTPVIGLPLLTVFVQRQIHVTTPFYLCHACELNIPVSSASSHVTSEQHCLNVFSYSKPDLVFLGCRNWHQIAQEEERCQGKQKMVLQVCELHRKRFTEFRTLAYEKFMETIENHCPKLKKCIQVEKRVTLQSFSKSLERKSPLLGLHFMVKYTTTQHYFKCSYLCLLCEKILPERHAITHVLSFPHIYAYLDMAHPGSLRKEDSEQVSLILDLAQQAEKITPNMTLWEVDMSIGMFNKIEKSSYMSAVNVLQEVFKDKGLGELKPSVVPGARLVSTFKINKENTSSGELHGHTSSDTEKLKIDETCTITPMPKTEEKMNSESPDPLNTAHEELLKTTCISSMQVQDAEPSLATTDLNLKTSDPQIPFLNDEQSEPLKLVQKTVNQEERSDHSSTVDDLTVKLQDSSVPELQDSSVPEQQSTDLGKPALQLEALQEPVQAPACLNPADHQTHSNCSEIERYLKTPHRQPVIGLKTVIECCSVGQQPFYMCVTCVERCEESDIIKHLLSHEHRLQYLESIGICGPEPGKEKVMPEWLQAQADMVEKTQGCGKAETLKLDAKDYHEIFTAPIVTALESLRLSIFKLASEIDAEKPYLKSDENHGSETFKKARETEEKDSPHAHQKKTVRFTEPDTEPGTPKQNSDDPARSSPHLWSYLTSETRTEPVIGLSMITEYRNPNGANSFLCSCCNVILSTQSYMGHLISSWHRFNYIKSKDPDFVVAGKEEIKIAELRKKAQILQDSEGWGCLKVVDKESKQPKKKTQQASGDVEKETPDNVQKQEPSEIICYTEPQDLVPKDQTSQPKPTKQQNEKKTNSAELNAVTDSEDSVNTQKLEPSQTGYDTGEENVLREPQDHNLVPKPSKSQIKKKLSKHHAVIGLNFVTCVHHDKKKLFFCELCSARGHFDHLSSETHRKAYVEHKYPGCTATGTIMKKQLNKIALSLATVERSTGIGMKKLNVTAQVFTALRTAPLSEALSHLKLLLTKPEDGVDLKACISQPEPSTFTEHTVHSMQQEKPPLLENHSCPGEIPIPRNSAYSCRTSPLISCCPFSVPIPFIPNSSTFSRTVSSPFLSSTDLHAPAYHSKHISTPPPLLSSTNSSTVPSSTFVHISHPLSSQPERPVQCVLIPHLEHETVSPLSASDCQDVTNIAPLYSCTLPTPVKLTYLMGCEEPTDVTGAVQETVPGVSTLFAESKGAIVGRHFMMEQSNAFRFLNVKGLLAKDPIIGLSNVWECRRISQPTFFLCLNCAEKVSREKFCNHMISERHQRLTIETQYQEEFHQWQRHSVHQMTFRDLAKTLALKEKGFDAKVFKLNKPQYESVTSADFHDAFVILKMMDMSAQPSHPAGQNQRSNEISTARSPSECVEAEKERDDQSHRSCENATQIQELHSSQVEIREFYNDRNSTAYTSLQSQSSPKALPESKAQTPQPQHQSVVIIDLTANSNSEKPTSHFPKPITKRTTKIPATETQESATAGLHERMPAHTFPHTTTIKPEKSDHEQGNSPKHTDLNYITKNKTEADALVGLSAVIECRNDGQALLDLCVSCSTIIEPKLINYHLVKSGHRYNYLKRRYPHMFEDWSDSDSRRENSKKLMKFAHKAKVANEDEPGDPQVMELNCDDLKEVKAMSYDKAIIHLQKIRKGKKLRALKTCISPKIKKKLIKQERMETDITQYSQQQPGMISHGPRRALKRRAVQEDLPVQSFPGKKQCSDVPSSLLKQFPTMGKNQETSDSSIKQSMISGSDLGSDTQFQQESSILTTANPNRSLYFIPTTDPKSSKSINPNSHTYKRTTSMHKNVLKNCENQDTSSSITAPQQKDSFPNTISALSSMKGQEIARLSERASVSKSLRGNAWNYENRQFSPETASMTITNTVAENSADTGVLKQQFIASSVHNYNRNIPDKFLVSNHGGATSITSQVTPDYAMTHQYPMYKHTEYPSNTFNTAASDYLPVRERAMNYESAAPGISTNATDLMNANSAQTSHTDYQGLPVYQQIHDPETCQAYYARYSYNQALHTNQTAADDENVTSTPALEHGVYPLASWPQKKN